MFVIFFIKCSVLLGECEIRIIQGLESVQYYIF